MADKPAERVRLGAELLRLRKAGNLTQAELADQVGVTKAYISQLETGFRGFGVPSDFAEKVSAVFAVPVSHWATFTEAGALLAGASTPDATVPKEKPYELLPFDPNFQLPSLGTAAGGKPIDPQGRRDQLINFMDYLPAGPLHAARIKGSSMVGEGIHDGDLVIVRLDPDPPNNSIVLAWIGAGAGGGMTLKRLIGGQLHPRNPAEDAEPFPVDGNVELVGVYLAHFHRDAPPRTRKRPR